MPSGLVGALSLWWALVGMVFMVLMVSVPYASALAFVVDAYRRMFRRRLAEAPEDWRWQLCRPVLTAGITPLAVAGLTELSTGKRQLLVGVPVLVVVAIVVFMTVVKSTDYHMLKRRPPIGRRRELAFPGSTIVLGCALLIVCAAWLANIYVVVTPAGSAPSA